MFRFTIRDVLWLTVVVALAVGWWIDRSGIQQSRETWKSSAEMLRDFANDGPLNHTLTDDGELIIGPH